MAAEQRRGVSRRDVLMAGGLGALREGERAGQVGPELDPAVLLAERQRFDPAGHYHRPDVLQLKVKGPR